MGSFTPRVMRLLSDQLTGTSVREIDALFDDRGVALGPPQPMENDESIRRERMRRYLVTLDLRDAADAQRLTAVLGDMLQTIIQDGSVGWAMTTASARNGSGSCARMALKSTRLLAQSASAEPGRS